MNHPLYRKTSFLRDATGLLALCKVSMRFLFHTAISGPKKCQEACALGIDEAKLVTLRGNVRPEATVANDRGPGPENFPMEHMMLGLQRPPELQRELQQFIDDLHDSQSLNFHKWITAQQLGERFGVAQQDIDRVTRWLESYGFKAPAHFERWRHAKHR